MGYEGANVLFDTFVHPLMMGLEEHLIGMFREDFEFHGDAAPSHLGGAATARAVEATAAPAAPVEAAVPDEAEAAKPASLVLAWSADAEKELKKIPFFVRGKARRNTERYALERGVTTITIEALYDAKAHFGR
jgi:light-independent protochlorophyllide reductase subunit B